MAARIAPDRFRARGGKFHVIGGALRASGPVDQRKIACFASRKSWVQIPAGPSVIINRIPCRLGGVPLFSVWSGTPSASTAQNPPKMKLSTSRSTQNGNGADRFFKRTGFAILHVTLPARPEVRRKP